MAAAGMPPVVRPVCGLQLNVIRNLLIYIDFFCRLIAFSGVLGSNGGQTNHGDRAMKGDKDVLKHLNKILKNELTAINQYFLHSRMLNDWGVRKLGKHEHDESIDEMKHADRLITRILFLDGLPNLQELNKLLIGESVKEIIECDLRLEMLGIPDLKDAIVHCEKVQDYTSRNLFREILDSEEEHVDFLETQLSMIEKMGLQNYVQLQSEAED